MESPFFSGIDSLKGFIEADFAAHAKRPADTTDWMIDKSPGSNGYSEIAYDIGLEPLIRSIPDPLGKLPEIGHITRNRYGAEVLNTRLLPIVDVDHKLSDETDPRLFNGQFIGTYCDGPELKEACEFLAGGGRKERMTEHHAFHDTKAARQASTLAYLSNYAIDAPGEWLIEETAELQIAIYGTCGGYRLVFNQPMPLRSGRLETASGVMKFLYADPRYADICVEQRLYRARLTPKPWRPWESSRVVQLTGTVVNGEYQEDRKPQFADLRLAALSAIHSGPYEATPQQEPAVAVAA